MREIKTKITLQWVHKNFATTVHTSFFYFSHDIISLKMMTKRSSHVDSAYRSLTRLHSCDVTINCTMHYVIWKLWLEQWYLALLRHQFWSQWYSLWLCKKTCYYVSMTTSTYQSQYELTKDTHTPPSQVSYGVSTVSILENYHVIKRFACIHLFGWPINIFTDDTNTDIIHIPDKNKLNNIRMIYFLRYM